MNEQNLEIAKTFINKSYLRQGFESGIRKRQNLVQALLSNRRLPKVGWDDPTIEYFLGELSIMDSNNFIDNIGAGEREARIYSGLVAKRHYFFGHGIGRSGDITETQPKAAGSSLLHEVTRYLVKDALRISGLSLSTIPLLLPMATGMSMTLVLLALKAKSPGRSHVVWPRIDQKSCFKAIVAAGCVPIVIENIIEGDALVTNVESLAQVLDRLGDSVLCVLSTTSCFAPRHPDSVVALSRICQEREIPHVVNNAYGLQCSNTMKQLARACRVGRVDVIVQSTDKNFMVPVGGAIIASQNKELIEHISQTYPGRASASPLVDMFITLMSMGSDGYKEVLSTREALVPYFKQTLSNIAIKYGERLLDTPCNSISFGMTLKTVTQHSKHPSFLGSMLFNRCVSGTRVISKTMMKEISGHQFSVYGSHHDEYPEIPYLTAACAIGMTRSEIDEFCQRLDKTLKKFVDKDTVQVSEMVMNLEH